MGVRCVEGVFVCVWEVCGGSEIALNNMFKDVLNYFAGKLSQMAWSEFLKTFTPKKTLWHQ